MAYRTITQPRTVLFQNFYRSESRSVAFPRPGELEPAVEFWRKAYTVRRRSEVVIHDVRYLDVICLVPVRYVGTQSQHGALRRGLPRGWYELLRNVWELGNMLQIGPLTIGNIVVNTWGVMLYLCYLAHCLSHHLTLIG